MRKHHLRSTLLPMVGSALVLVLLSGSAMASTMTWTGAVDANWSTATAPTNWNTAVPANGDSLVFDDSGAMTTNTDDLVGLSVASVNFSGTTNSYTLNGTTPLALTGGATAMVNNSSQIQIVNLPLNFGAATTMTGGTGSTSALKLNGLITNTAASGSVNLNFSGVGTVTDNFASAGGSTVFGLPNAADNWTVVDNATNSPITIASGNIITGSGTLNFGTATSAPNLTITAVGSAGDHTIGPDPGAAGTLNMVNGTLLLKTRLNTKNGNINVSGGDLQIWNQFQVSNSGVAEVSTVNVSGGILEVRNSSGSVAGGPIFVASRGMGTLTITGGTIVCSNLDVSRGAAPAVGGVASQGIVNLNGGTITCNQVTTASANVSGTGAGSTAVFNFNGGTLKSKQNNTTFIRESQSAGTNIPLTVNVQSGGAIIDCNTFAIGTSKALLHDASLGATPDGGLTLRNTGTPAGTLTLSGVNTYTGNTTIQAGTLILNSSTSNNNIGTSGKIVVGDTAANSAAGLNVTGITTAGGFQLQSAQTLAGFGTITGAVAALAGSFVGPGNSIGTLTESTSMALAGTLNIDLNDADPGIVDLLNDTGNLDISAATSAVTFNVIGAPSAAAYVFAKYGSLTGSAFGAVNSLPSGYGIDYNYLGGNQIALVSVPEPMSLVLAALGGLSLALFRRFQ